MIDKESRKALLLDLIDSVKRTINLISPIFLNEIEFVKVGIRFKDGQTMHKDIKW